MVEKRKVITAMVPFFMNLKDSKKTDINQIIIVMGLHLQAFWGKGTWFQKITQQKDAN